MIRGLLSGDYWIFVGCCSAAFVLFFLGIRAGISAGNWNLPVLVLVPAAASIQAEKKGTTPKIQGHGKRDKHQ